MPKYPNYDFRRAVLTPATALKDESWAQWIPKEFNRENVFVLNPMHIVTLSKQTKSRFVKFVEVFKKFSEKWFSHVLLLLFLFLYGCLGAYIFRMLESKTETIIKGSVINMREKIIRELWWSSQRFNKGWWNKLAYIRMKEFERQLHESCVAGITSDADDTVWTFWGALFFSSTVFTTIGYGNVVPKTNAGRVATIIYAFVGIPLLLMVLADFGKLLTRGIKIVFKKCRDIYYDHSFRKVRRVGRKATAMPTQYVTVALDAVNRKMSSLPMQATTTIKPKKEDSNKRTVDDKTKQKKTDVKSAVNDKAKENKSKHTKSSFLSPNPNPSTSAAPTITCQTPEPTQFEVDDEFNLPITFAITLLLLYMMLGAAVFTLWENWSFFESFYFIYISLSTIGFGDYVPRHPLFMMCTFLYLLFGLALTSMCINVVQEKLSATFQKAKMRIGETMGLDVQQIMEQEMEEEKSLEKGSNKNRTSERSEDKTKNPKSFVLQEHGIGNSLKERREKKRSPASLDGKSSSEDERAKDRRPKESNL